MLARAEFANKQVAKDEGPSEVRRILSIAAVSLLTTPCKLESYTREVHSANIADANRT